MFLFYVLFDLNVLFMIRYLVKLVFLLNFDLILLSHILHDIYY